MNDEQFLKYQFGWLQLCLIVYTSLQLRVFVAITIINCNPCPFVMMRIADYVTGQ